MDKRAKVIISEIESSVGALTRKRKINNILDINTSDEIMFVASLTVCTFLKDNLNIKESYFDNILISRNATHHIGLWKLPNNTVIRVFGDLLMRYDDMRCWVGYDITNDMPYEHLLNDVYF
jgi:hypothetical protein